MNKSINEEVFKMILKDDRDGVNSFIKKYQPFIIKTVSDLKGQYLDINNDDELSIAMLAFHEAMTRYQPGKGNFLGFAKLVIESRVKTYWAKIKQTDYTDYEDIIHDTDNELRDEIELFEKTLLDFGLDFENLVELSPKHEDTRKRAIEIGRKTSKRKPFVDHIYEKKRLPITLISKAFEVSIKIIKRSKSFILSVVIIYDKKLKHIEEWIK